jgi:hypothetical protein
MLDPILRSERYTEKTPEDLCNHGNPKQKFTKTKIEKSVELCKRKLEINLGKRIKSEEVIKRKPEFSVKIAYGYFFVEMLDPILRSERYSFVSDLCLYTFLSLVQLFLY